MGLFKKKKNMDDFQGDVYHVSGLPLPEKAPCKISIDSEKVVVNGGGSEFTLLLSQINAVDFEIDVNVTSVANSSLAKGIAGGLLFGPVGAIVGSRPTNKEKRTVTSYAFVSYRNSEGAPAALVFTNIPGSKDLAKFVDKLRPLIPKNPKQSVQL